MCCVVPDKELGNDNGKQNPLFAYTLILVDALRIENLKNKIRRTKIFKISCAIIKRAIIAAYVKFNESVQEKKSEKSPEITFFCLKKYHYCLVKVPLLHCKSATFTK